MNRDEILKTNKHYWDTYADLWLGTTALPEYGVHFVTEDELHLFGDVSGKKILETCCGLDCETCDARIATITNDNTLREKPLFLSLTTGKLLLMQND